MAIPSVYLTSLHMTKSSYQAFPHHICKLQAIKDWRWGWLGNETTSVHIYNYIHHETFSFMMSLPAMSLGLGCCVSGKGGTTGGGGWVQPKGANSMAAHSQTQTTPAQIASIWWPRSALRCGSAVGPLFAVLPQSSRCGSAVFCDVYQFQ